MSVVFITDRDGSTQLRERLSDGVRHPGIGQVTGFALRIVWRPDAAPPTHLLPQEDLVNGMSHSFGHKVSLDTHSM